MNLKVFIIVSLVVSLISCNNTTNLNPVENNISDSSFLAVSETDLNIGSNIKLYGGVFCGSIEHWEIKYEGNTKWFEIDSVKTDTLYSHIPYSSKTGIIKVKKLCDIKNSSEMYFVDSIIISEDSPDSILVKWSDLNYRITSASAVFNKLSYIYEAESIRWEVKKIEDTVKIMGYHPWWESYNYYELQLLDQGEEKLPKYLSGKTVKHQDVGVNKVSVEIEKSLIKIDKWNINGIISGRVLSSDNENNYIFWFEFN